MPTAWSVFPSSPAEQVSQSTLRTRPKSPLITLFTAVFPPLPAVKYRIPIHIPRLLFQLISGAVLPKSEYTAWSPADTARRPQNFVGNDNQRFTVFLQIIHACNNAVERRSCTCAFRRKQLVASRLPKSSSKIPSYCRESLRFAKSSVLSTVAKPFPARSARCRAIRASADLPNGCMVARYNRLCAFSHTSRSACSDLPEAAPPVTKISIFAPLSELDLQSALIFDTIILSE